MLKLLQKRGLLATCLQQSHHLKNLHTGLRLSSVYFDRIAPPRQPFKSRHIGPDEFQQQQMLQVLDCQVNHTSFRDAVTLCVSFFSRKLFALPDFIEYFCKVHQD